MSFTLSPAVVAPLGSLTASGTGTRKRPVRIVVSPLDPVAPGKVLATFTIPANGRFSGRMLVAPPGPARLVKILLEQPRVSDGVWAQTASAEVQIVIATGGSTGGGGTIPLPPNTPPVPPPDITPPDVSNVQVTAITTSGATINATTSEPATIVVRHSIEGSSLAGASTTSPSPSGTSHSRSISGYPADVIVYFQVIATDTAGNVRTDGIRSFRTQAVVVPPGPEPPGSEVEVSNVAELRAKVDDLNVSIVNINPGTYHPGSDIMHDYFLPPLARTADNPLLVRAVNIPADPSDPHDVIFTSRMYFRNRRGSYTTWQGISFETLSIGDTGIVNFGGYGEPGPTHVKFLDTRFVDNTPRNQTTSHFWYLSDGSSSYIEIDRYYAEGNDRLGFTGFHAYHDQMGNHITLKHGTIRKVYCGILMWAGSVGASVTDFLAEDMDIQDVGHPVSLRWINGVLRRVDASNFSSGGMLRGLITLDDCSGMPSVTAP